MGHIQAFTIDKMIKDFNIQGYIETGTGIGDSLSHAIKFPFEKIFSIEFDKKLYNKAIDKFLDPRLLIINDLSINALPFIISKIDKDEKYIFFLDAHFPEADFGTAPDRYLQSINKYKENALPLEAELKIIAQTRPLHQDIIIIDDVWIYEKGPFESGNWSERDKLNIGDMKFVYNIFDKYYTINKIYKQQGYLILTPEKSF
jgi:hypothetical protein